MTITDLLLNLRIQRMPSMVTGDILLNLRAPRRKRKSGFPVAELQTFHYGTIELRRAQRLPTQNIPGTTS